MIVLPSKQKKAWLTIPAPDPLPPTPFIFITNSACHLFLLKNKHMKKECHVCLFSFWSEATNCFCISQISICFSLSCDPELPDDFCNILANLLELNFCVVFLPAPSRVFLGGMIKPALTSFLAFFFPLLVCLASSANGLLDLVTLEGFRGWDTSGFVFSSATFSSDFSRLSLLAQAT